MKSTGHPDYRDRITDEAADWFTRLRDPEVTQADRDAFADWLAASAENVREYLLMAGLSGDVAQLQAQPTADELIRAAVRTNQENIVSFEKSWPAAAPRLEPAGPAVVRRERSRPRWVASSLAAMLALVAIVVFWRSGDDSTVYRTATGEQKSFPLPDGSVVILNAVSELRVRYTRNVRDLQLVSGEALFDVAKDPPRPFRVHSGATLIQAIGTRFNVYHRAADTNVAVVEGVIEVRPLEGRSWASKLAPPVSAQGKSPAVRVAHGKEARVDASSGAIVVVNADLKRVAAWRERRLIFESRPLREVVAEFNLYNDAALKIDDPALERIEVSGAFYANDPESFALFLDEAGIATFVGGGSRTMELRSTRRH